MAKGIYQTAGEIILLPCEQICPDPIRSQRMMNDETMEELMASIEENGLIEPIVVRPVEDEMFLVVAGERRFAACERLGLVRIPCIVITCDPLSSAVFSLIDNQQRKILDYFEEAQLLRSLLCEYQISVMDLSQRICKTVGYINKKLQLLELSDPLRETISANQLDEECAALLLQAPEQNRSQILEQIIQCGYGVIETRTAVEQAKMSARERNNIMIFKDITVFTNTVEHAIATMRQAGIQADAGKNETETYIEYTVKISKTG